MVRDAFEDSRGKLGPGDDVRVEEQEPAPARGAPALVDAHGEPAVIGTNEERGIALEAAQEGGWWAVVGGVIDDDDLAVAAADLGTGREPPDESDDVGPRVVVDDDDREDRLVDRVVRAVQGVVGVARTQGALGGSQRGASARPSCTLRGLVLSIPSPARADPDRATRLSARVDKHMVDAAWIAVGPEGTEGLGVKP